MDALKVRGPAPTRSGNAFTGSRAATPVWLWPVLGVLVVVLVVLLVVLLATG